MLGSVDVKGSKINIDLLQKCLIYVHKSNLKEFFVKRVVLFNRLFLSKYFLRMPFNIFTHTKIEGFPHQKSVHRLEPPICIVYE